MKMRVMVAFFSGAILLNLVGCGSNCSGNGYSSDPSCSNYASSYGTSAYGTPGYGATGYGSSAYPYSGGSYGSVTCYDPTSGQQYYSNTGSCGATGAYGGATYNPTTNTCYNPSTGQSYYSPGNGSC